MPFSSGKTMLALLFAILTSSCASQNAMSLVPDSIRLDIVRDKAAKAGPVSVEEMLGKARAGAAPGQGDPAAAPPFQETKGTRKTRPPEMPEQHWAIL